MFDPLTQTEQTLSTFTRADLFAMRRPALLGAVAMCASAAAFQVTPYPASVLRSPLARRRTGPAPRARELVPRTGWIESCDLDTGECFYYNEETGESQWEPPPGFQVGGAAPPGGATTGGWVALVDEASGDTYYFNEQTGQSQWEPPQQAASAQQIVEHDVYDPRSVTQSYDQYLAEPPAGQ